MLDRKPVLRKIGPEHAKPAGPGAHDEDKPRLATLPQHHQGRTRGAQHRGDLGHGRIDGFGLKSEMTGGPDDPFTGRLIVGPAASVSAKYAATASCIAACAASPYSVASATGL